MIERLKQEVFLPYFQQAEKDPSQFKVGLEQELLGFVQATHRRITYKEHILPILQGFAKPANDMSRGASVEDLIGVTAITSVQAQGA